MERLPEFIGNHLFLFSLLIAISALLIWNLFGDILTGVKLLLPDEVTRMINREDAKVVDLRHQSDFEKGHIIDALNINVDQLASGLKKLKRSKDKGIIFCCTNGSVSIKEARKLMKGGHTKVYCLKGGIISWENASLPLAKGVNKK